MSRDKTAPGGAYDPVAVALWPEGLGIDRPLMVQFVDFLSGIATFDYGDSMWTGRPISTEIAAALRAQPAGGADGDRRRDPRRHPARHVSAVNQNTWIDVVVRTSPSPASPSRPSGWHPDHPGHPPCLRGAVGHALDAADRIRAIWVDPWYNLSMLIWPALATGYRYSAVATRMTRSALLEVLREDYVRTARAKGLWRSSSSTATRCGNALLPVMTVIGIEFAFLIGGLVVTEQVFNLNGLGQLSSSRYCKNDYTMTQALVMIVVMVFVFANFLVDILYAWLDPRIRYS